MKEILFNIREIIAFKMLNMVINILPNSSFKSDFIESLHFHIKNYINNGT